MSRNGFNLLRLKFGSLAFAPLCLLMTGCVTSSVSAAGTRFHYSWWLPLGLFMAGLAFVPLGLFILGVRFGSIRLALTKQSPRFGWGLVIVGPIAALGFAPSLFIEQVTVTNKVIDVRSGLWPMTANQTIDFDSVKTLRITWGTIGSRRKRSVQILSFEMKSGSNAQLWLDNDVKGKAGYLIETMARARDIPVVR